MLTGSALLLGVMLVAAGAPKLIAPVHVAGALRRALTRGSDRTLLRAGRLLGAWELALGTAFLTVGGRALTALVALTFLGFAAFVVLAVRRGTACGCWASLSEGPAGGTELARTLTLATLATTVLLTAPPTVPLAAAWNAPAPTLLWAAAALTATWSAAVAGGRLLPVRDSRVRRRLDAQRAPGRIARVGAQGAVLAGFLNTGTKGGRDRYAAARQPMRPAPRSAPEVLRVPPRPQGARHARS